MVNALINLPYFTARTDKFLAVLQYDNYFHIKTKI